MPRLYLPSSATKLNPLKRFTLNNKFKSKGSKPAVEGRNNIAVVGGSKHRADAKLRKF